MVTQQDVLRFFAKHTADSGALGARDLAREFWISREAAAGHLARLWRERLIETDSDRPARFRFRLKPGEALKKLRFRLAARGLERLRWYERQDEDKDTNPFFIR